MREIFEGLLLVVGLGLQAMGVLFLLSDNLVKAVIISFVALMLVVISEYMKYLDEERELNRRLDKYSTR